MNYYYYFLRNEYKSDIFCNIIVTLLFQKLFFLTFYSSKNTKKIIVSTKISSIATVFNVYNKK